MTTPNNITQAAGRLPDSPSHAFELARQILAEMDETPADEAWIASLGWAKDELVTMTIWTPTPRHFEVRTLRPENTVDLRLSYLIRRATRGQVRAACRLFGIELKEPASA